MALAIIWQPAAPCTNRHAAACAQLPPESQRIACATALPGRSDQEGRRSVSLPPARKPQCGAEIVDKSLRRPSKETPESQPHAQQSVALHGAVSGQRDCDVDLRVAHGVRPCSASSSRGASSIRASKGIARSNHHRQAIRRSRPSPEPCGQRKHSHAARQACRHRCRRR